MIFCSLFLFLYQFNKLNKLCAGGRRGSNSLPAHGALHDFKALQGRLAARSKKMIFLSVFSWCNQDNQFRNLSALLCPFFSPHLSLKFSIKSEASMNASSFRFPMTKRSIKSPLRFFFPAKCLRSRFLLRSRIRLPSNMLTCAV